MSTEMKEVIGHTAIRAKDLSTSIKFYKETLGLPIVRKVKLPDGGDIVFFPGVEIHQLDKPSNASEPDDAKFFFHIGFEIKNIESIVRKLKEKGVSFEVELDEIKFPKEGTAVKYSMFKDPDGILLELAEWSKL